FFVCTLLPPSLTLFPYTTLFRSSRPSSYVDVGSDGCEARRVDHRHAFPVAARRRRVWVLRRGEHVLHGRTPDRHVSRAAVEQRQIGRHTSELQSRGHLVCRLLLE